MDKNIEFNHKLEEYNKKYRNRKPYLLKITKKEVEDFDRKNPTVIKNYLLKDRKWWLIGDTYYEIPKAPRYTWFRNLNAGAQIATSALIAGGLVTAVVVPTVMNLRNKGEGKEETRDVSIDPSAIAHCSCTSKLVDGNLEITLKVDDGYEISDINKITINKQELDKSDYTFSDNKIIIEKDVLMKYAGNIVIIPKIDAISFEKYLNFDDFDDTENTCSVGGKKYDEESKIIMPKKLIIPETFEHEGKMYNVTVIRDEGFKGCKFEKDSVLVCPSTLKRINDDYGYAFEDVKNLKKIILNEGLTNIGGCGAFEDCSDLEEINIPKSLETPSYGEMPDCCFRNCCCLNKVIIDNSDAANLDDEDYDGDLFEYCDEVFVKEDIDITAESIIGKNFKHVISTEMPGYKKYFKKSLFKYETNEEDKTCVITGFESSFSKYYFTIPTHINGYLVTKIGDKAFAGDENFDFESVYCTKYLKEIGSEAFSKSSIKEIVLAEGITKIGDSCFSGSKLKEINIPSTIKIENIGNDAFNCNYLSTVYLDNQEFVDNIDNPCQKLFANTFALYINKNLNAPSSESYIIKKLGFVKAEDEGEYSYWTNEPFKYDYFNDYSMNCSLTGITAKFNGGDCEIPSTFHGYKVENIYNSPFENVAISMKMKLNEGLLTIGYHTFLNCTGLTEINIPSSVNSIVYEAFKGCTSLKTVSLENGTFSVSTDNCNYLFENADTIYIKSDVVQPSAQGQYIYDNFSDQGESAEKSGYHKWTRNS